MNEEVKWGFESYDYYHNQENSTIEIYCCSKPGQRDLIHEIYLSAEMIKFLEGFIAQEKKNREAK